MHHRGQELAAGDLPQYPREPVHIPHTHTHTQIRRYADSQTHTDTHKYTQIHKCRHTHAGKDTETDAHIHTKPHTDTVKHTQTHTQTHTNTDTHTDMYTHTFSAWLVGLGWDPALVQLATSMALGGCAHIYHIHIQTHTCIVYTYRHTQRGFL